MILTRLALQKFKRFDDLDLQLTRGINVIKGPNESGKSSLIQGLLAGFFWKVTSTRQEVQECRAWGTDEGFALRMVGEHEGEPWDLHKDFGARTSQLAYGGETITDPQRINERLADWLGLASEELYVSTAGIRQEEVQDLSSGRRQLAESLQRTVAGGGAGAAGALKELKVVLDDLTRGQKSPAKHPGLIAAAQQELQRLEVQRGEVAAKVERSREASGRVAEASVRCDSLRQEQEALHQLVAESLEKLRLEEEVTRLESDFERAGREQALLDESAELEKKASHFEPVASVLEHREKLEGLKQQGAGLEATRENLEDELQRYEGELARAAAGERILLALMVILAAAGVAGLFFTAFAFVPLALAVVLAVGLSFRRLVLRRSRSQAGVHLRQRIDDLTTEAHRVESELQGLARAAGCSTVQELWNLGAEYAAFDARREANRQARDTLGLESGDGARQQEIRALANELAAKKTRIAELAPTSLAGVDLRKSQLRQEQIEAELRDLEADNLRLSVLTDGDEQEALFRLEEEIAEVSERLAGRQHQAQVYQLASELIAEAGRSTTTSMAEILRSEIGEHISLITGGRYRRIEVDPETLRISVFSEEKGAMLETAALSHGTVDQLYLAARLSLMRNIAGNKRPPLLLDDSFVAYDADRLNRAMQLVARTCRDYQVLLFTCYDNYDSFADNLINLEQVSRVRRLELE